MRAAREGWRKVEAVGYFSRSLGKCEGEAPFPCHVLVSDVVEEKKQVGVAGESEGTKGVGGVTAATVMFVLCTRHPR